MPALLEYSAKQARMADLTRAIEDKSQVAKTLTDSRQAQVKATAAEEIANLVPETVSILNDAAQLMEGILRDGINGLDFRILVNAYVGFTQACELAVDKANQICEQAEAFGESPQTIAARNVIAKAVVQMQTLKPKVLSWKKVADRRPPEIDLARIEQGKEQIRQGKFKTPQQILESIQDLAK